MAAGARWGLWSCLVLFATTAVLAGLAMRRRADDAPPAVVVPTT